MRFSPRGYRGKRPLGEYFRRHFHITTSGNFNDPAFRCTLEVMGRDRVYFSTDYPYETMEDAAEWFDSTTVIGEDDGSRSGAAMQSGFSTWTSKVETFGTFRDAT